MNLKALTATTLFAFCLMPLSVHAENSESRELKAAVDQLYQQVAAGDFKNFFSHFQLGSRGYLPDGVVGEIPDEKTRQLVIAKYEQEYERGTTAKLLVKDFKATLHGTLAITTFLADGIIQTSSDARPQKKVERVSLVWTKTASGWKIVHWHRSSSRPNGKDA